MNIQVHTQYNAIAFYNIHVTTIKYYILLNMRDNTRTYKNTHEHIWEMCETTWAYIKIEKVNINNEVHFYGEHPLYGEMMPLGGPYLTNGELDFIEDWIWAGAPESGIVADPIILNDNSTYEPPDFQPLDPPELGMQ